MKNILKLVLVSLFFGVLLNSCGSSTGSNSNILPSQGPDVSLGHFNNRFLNSDRSYSLKFYNQNGFSYIACYDVNSDGTDSANGGLSMINPAPSFSDTGIIETLTLNDNSKFEYNKSSQQLTVVSAPTSGFSTCNLRLGDIYTKN